MEQICDNVQYFTSRICHDWGDLSGNFKNLEQNLKYLDGIITIDDIKDLKNQAINYFTSHDDRNTQKIALIKLNALTDAMNSYINQLQVKNRSNELISLETFYNINLESYKQRIAESQRQQTQLEMARNKIHESKLQKKGGLFSNCCGQGGNIDDNDEITYLEGEKILSPTGRINQTRLTNGYNRSL